MLAKRKKGDSKMSNNGANKMRYIGTRVDTDLHEKIEQYCEEHGLSMSELMRTSVEQMFAEPQTNGKHSLVDAQTNGEQGIHALTEQLQIKDSQLQRKDEQLEALQTELSDARRGSEEAGKRSDMLLAQITNHLDRAPKPTGRFPNTPLILAAGGW